MRGRVADGLPLLEQAVRQAEALKVVFRLALWLAWLGEAHLLAGRPDEAIRFAEKAVARAVTHKESGHHACALRLIGEIAAAQSPPDVKRADVAYGEALALARPLGMRPLEAHCLMGLGRLHQRADRKQQAHAEFMAAASLFRSMEMTYWLARAEERLAEI